MISLDLNDYKYVYFYNDFDKRLFICVKDTPYDMQKEVEGVINDMIGEEYYIMTKFCYIVNLTLFPVMCLSNTIVYFFSELSFKYPPEKYGGFRMS